jgi:hypothetical protein
MVKVKSNSTGGRQVDGESISGYFRGVFKERPDLLRSRSNAALLARWLKDHPSETEVPERVKSNLANIKSLLRKKKRQRRAGEEQTTTFALKLSAVPRRGLASLEENIDNCLDQARSLDRDGLESIIKLLRRARNEVVWKLGE